LQSANQHFRPSVKTALAVLLIGMVLLLNAMEACEPLHKLIHHDADKPGHECVATLLEELLDHAQRNPETPGYLLAGALVGVVGGQNPFPQIQGNGFHAPSLPHPKQYGYSFV
jgi:hypothetical protein